MYLPGCTFDYTYNTFLLIFYWLKIFLTYFSAVFLPYFILIQLKRARGTIRNNRWLFRFKTLIFCPPIFLSQYFFVNSHETGGKDSMEGTYLYNCTLTRNFLFPSIFFKPTRLRGDKTTTYVELISRLNPSEVVSVTSALTVLRISWCFKI